MKKQTFNVLISIDDGYLDRACETLLSFKNHNDVFFNVYLLYEELKTSTISKLEKYILEKQIGKLIPIKIDLSMVNLPLNISYISKVTYYRLFAPYFISESRFLYIDCDIICQGNISQFYNMDFENNAIIGCPNMLDSSKIYLDSVMKSNVGISLDDVYINAGVLLIDVENYKKFIKMDELIDFINNTNLLLEFQDQDVINHVFHKVTKLADNLYNFQMNGVDTGLENYQAPIVHYSEYYKPWNDDYYNTKKASVYYDFLLKNGKEKECFELASKHLRNETSALNNTKIDKNDAIDIIIPIYNAKKTLDDCLSSIKKQIDVPKLKVYLIDDASSESYDEIIKKYSDLDISYYKVKKNGGPGAARNKGIELSNSKYVTFLDADDVFLTDISLSVMYKLIKYKNPDVITTTIYRDLYDGFMLHTADEFGLHGKLFSREFIDKHNLKFNSTYYFEDTGFNILLKFFGASVLDYDCVTYYWRNYHESLSNQKVKYLELVDSLSFDYDFYIKNSDNNSFLINFFITLKWISFVLKNISNKTDYQKLVKSTLKIYKTFKCIYNGIYYEKFYQYLADRYLFDDIMNFMSDVIKEYASTDGVENLTEYEKSLVGLPYYPLDNECGLEQRIYPKLINEYNDLYYTDNKKAVDLLNRSMFYLGPGVKILPPIHANWGCKNVLVGENTFINSNVVFVDDAKINIGKNVLIGPNVTFCTSSHPKKVEERNKIIAKPITIEDHVWIGANVVILQGVTIGKNSIIGAGSVVTKNIPANKIAYGNPCTIKESINE